MYRLIFVDDEDMIRDCFAEIIDFGAYGFELVATFASAEAALVYLAHKDSRIDVVITDIKMGEMSGIDFCEQARARLPNLVLVLLTGYRDFEFAQRAIKQNVFDYLVKPTSYADLDNLFVRLKHYLEKQDHDARYAKSNEQPDSTAPAYTDVVQRMRELARTHFNQNFPLEHAAEQLAMSPAYLSRLFKQQCNQTYSDYQLSLRVRRAKELLADPTVKVYEVGYEIGYKDTQHFYKMFKHATGMTPSQYRIAQIATGKD